ncbi:MAG: peptidylprolyl isomerase [Oligoflexales bacterium]
MLKRVLFVFTLIISNFAFGRTLLDRLAAEVNGTPITYQEVASKAKRGANINISTYPAVEGKNTPYELSLNDMINTELVTQKAEELEIDISDEEVTEKIKEMMTEQNLTMDGLQEYLRGEGIPFEEYKSDFKVQLMFRRFIGRYIYPQISSTQKEIEFYYMKNSGASNENIVITLRHIFIGLTPDSPDTVKDGKQKLIDTIMEKLKGGMNFEQAVQMYSEAPDAKESKGLMGTVSLKDLVPEFREAIAAVNKDQFTQPVSTSAGIHIFYVVDKALAESDDFNKVKGEIEQKLRQEKSIRQVNKWLADQRMKAKIKVFNDEK